MKSIKISTLIILFFLAAMQIYFVNWKIWLADYYVAKGDLISAIKLSSPHRDFLLKEQAVDLEVMAELEKAIQRRPLDYFLRLAYVEAALRLSPVDKNFFQNAEKHLQKALLISPKRTQTYYVLAKLKVKNSDREGLEKVMNEALVLNHESGDTHFFYGVFYLQLGDVEKGSAELALAKKFNRPPLTPAEAKLLGDYYGDADFYKEAIHYYRRALIYNYQDQEALFKLALVYYYNNDLNLAKLFFNQLLSRFPSFKTTADFKKIEPILKQL